MLQYLLTMLKHARQKLRASKKILVCWYTEFKKYIILRVVFRGIKGIDKLDTNKNYFLFTGSFGDRLFTAPYLLAHLDMYPSSQIIAIKEDKEILDRFTNPNKHKGRILYLSLFDFQSLHNRIKLSPSLNYPIDIDDTPSWLLPRISISCTKGLKTGQVRSLHLADYPYFSDLVEMHGVSHHVFTKTILYLPPSAQAVTYPRYNFLDKRRVEEILGQHKHDQCIRGNVLINSICHSQISFSSDQIKNIARIFAEMKYAVYINISGAKDKENYEYHLEEENIFSFDAPGFLLPLICDLSEIVCGCNSGAMAIAQLYSCSNILNFYSRGVEKLGKAEKKDLLGGNFFENNIDHVRDHKDWADPSIKRKISKIWIENPHDISLSETKEIIKDFIESI